MNKAAVIYWSGTGNTEAMAKAVAEGAGAAGAEADLLACAD
ncbi:MAG: flavodoxin domain-containing protein, partial [Parasporobacterium sp.]|nr:flavodoxin domain-containing protein [Parasporobacterium sp.]